MPDISIITEIGGVPVSGIVCSAYKASRFGSVPVAYDTPAPSGAADATATSGIAFGGIGQAVLTVPTGETYWVAVPSGGHTAWVESPAAAAPPWVFDVNAGPYNAVGNGATDATAAWTNAIADAITYANTNQQVAEVVADPGVYVIGGVLRTDVGSAYAQIPLPFVPQANAKVTLVIRSKALGSIAPAGGGELASGTHKHGVILYSTLTNQVFNATYGNPSIIGGPNVTRVGVGHWSNIRLHLQRICFREGPNPSVMGVDAINLQQCICEDVLWDTTESVTTGGGGTALMTQPTKPTGTANYMPYNNNNAEAGYRGSCGAYGWYAGPCISEHTLAAELFAYRCKVGLNILGGWYHASKIQKASIEHCPYVLGHVDASLADASNPGVHWDGGSSTVARLDIDVLDIEDANNAGGGGDWADAITHIHDPDSMLSGRCGYHRVLGGLGVTTGPLTIVGGQNWKFTDRAKGRLTGLAAHNANVVTFTPGATTLITIDTVDGSPASIERNINAASPLAAGLYTVTTRGLYRITGLVRTTNPANILTILDAGIRISGTDTWIVQQSVGAGNYPIVNFSYDLYLLEGATIGLIVQANGAVATDAAIPCHLEIFKVDD